MLTKCFVLLVTFAAGLVSSVPTVPLDEISQQKTVNKEANGIDICSLPPDRQGLAACEAFIPKWTFNSAKGKCEPYIYGGCGGTENLFNTEDDCKARCARKGAISQQDPCILPKAAGNCKGFVPSFYFDAATGSCSDFVYTGCGGNNNRFNTEADCREMCRAHLVQQSPDAPLIPADQDPCKLPKAAGNCKGFVPSFYFDSASGSCSDFVYTGCGGNENRFNSETDCKEKCRAHLVQPEPQLNSGVVKDDVTGEGLTRQERCSLPPMKTASNQIACLAFIPSWTFNSTSGQCETYIYGGCGKTANLYSSENECKSVCTEPKVIKPQLETCSLPVAKGPCYAFFPRYAFIKEKNRCEYFVYGGCQGNANNFRTAEECYRTCGGDIPNTVPDCEKVTCPESNQRFVDRGCRPEYIGNACCPTSFSCPDEESQQLRTSSSVADEKVCWYRGVAFAVGSEIDQITQDNACQTRCTCVASDKHVGGATIKCHTIYCGVPYPPAGKTGCVLVTEPGACCPSYRCLEDTPANETCKYDGKSYLPGQYIPTGKNPCKICRCNKTSNGAAAGLSNLDCKSVQCLVENRIGCVPVYVPSVCCPISYKCFNELEVGKNKTKVIRLDPKPGPVQTLSRQSLTPEGRSIDHSSVTNNNDKPLPHRCLMAKDEGPCRMADPSYYYDFDEGDCFLFQYGGCKGNDNRFDTKEECRNVCQVDPSTKYSRIIRIKPVQPSSESEESREIITSSSADQVAQPKEFCFLPKQTGPCRMALPVYYYDVEQKKCLLFYFGGCKGNANQFETIEECEKACRPQEEDVPSPKLISNSEKVDEPETSVSLSSSESRQEGRFLPARCLLSKQEGPCKMSNQMFYFNAELGECQPFNYGGCWGNANRFLTIEECRESCSYREFRPRPKICSEAVKAGPCKAHFLSYYFNSRTGSCDTFWYGGCHGNRNRFQTEEDCQITCGVVASRQNAPSALETKEEVDYAKLKCQMPADVGPCRSVKERFYYDKDEKKCKVFSYGGCLGNANNFATETECLNACANEYQSAPSDIQKLNKSIGMLAPVRSLVPSRARFLGSEGSLQQKQLPSPQASKLQCKLGNLTLNLGERLIDSANPCDECVCSTPPELSCSRITCEPLPNPSNAICKKEFVPGTCCPQLSCVSANPPSIDVCEDVRCGASEHCVPQEQTDSDGRWMLPVGVCVKMETSSSDDGEN